MGEDANRNHSIITKDVAKEMAKTLPGCPIVGFYNEQEGDFEEHNRVIDISGGKFNVRDTTRPYGFVDFSAKVWFQKFEDDGVEHEYLMTEGYIWTDIYPESKRIIEKGNNQSMELHNELTKGKWSESDNGSPQFFIINEAVIQKLCILGENVEPCFEGAGIAAHFAFDNEFKTNMFKMMGELKAALQEGGYTQMALDEKLDVEIVEVEMPIAEDVEFKKKSDDEEEEKETSSKKDTDDSENKEKSDDSKNEEEDEDEKKKKKMNHSASEDEEEKCPDCGKPKSECTCKKDEKKNFSLEEIPEYLELQTAFSELKAKYEALEKEVEPLRAFKKEADKKEKQAMIDSYYMLSDSDKADVIANIDNYSVEDIEAKLAIICVRNKVSFSLENDKEEQRDEPMVYSLQDTDSGDSAPAWIKAVRDTARTMI